MAASVTPLKTERERRKLTGQQVAAAVGVSQATINRIENGARQPSPELADRLAKYFDNAVTRDQILFPEDYPDAAARPARRARKLASLAPEVR